MAALLLVHMHSLPPFLTWVIPDCVTQVQQFYITQCNTVWETLRQVCDRERGGGVPRKPTAIDSSALLPAPQGGRAWGGRDRGASQERVPQTRPPPPPLRGQRKDCWKPSGTSEGWRDAAERGRWGREQVLSNRAPCGATASERLAGSALLEFEGDTDTLHRFILNPCPSPRVFWRHGLLWSVEDSFS